MNVTPEQTKIEDGGTQNNSKAEIHGVGLFLAIGAIGLSLLSTGLWIATMVFVPQIIQSRIDASSAEALEVAKTAQKDAAIAKDWTDTKNAELKVLRGSK